MVSKGTRWKHYKTGGYYVVLDLVTHANTEEILVIYQSELTGNKYARPIKDFCSVVSDGPGHALRFQYAWGKPKTVSELRAEHGVYE